MIQNKITQLSNFLIRPKRRQYSVDDLGFNYMMTKFGSCTREDFQVEYAYNNSYTQKTLNQINKQEYNQESQIKIKLKASIFIPVHRSSINKQLPKQLIKQRICLVALHGNTGSRMSTISLLQPALKFGLAFAIFDFGGCGNSQGQYVTLGYYQKYQIAAVLQKIHNNFGYHKFILYGRSMGAASALFYTSQVYPLYCQNKQKQIQMYYQQKIKTQKSLSSSQKALRLIEKLNIGYFGYEVIGLITDSPYYNTKDMFMDMLNRKLWFVPSMAIQHLLGVVQSKAHQRLKNINIGYSVDSTFKENKQQKQQQLISMRGNNKVSNQFQQNRKSFSICHDIKISEQILVPFPLFIIYGQNDDVISLKHTLELFGKIQCEHMKLHILEGEGHGNHRKDQVKISAIQWVLQWEVLRKMRRLQRDAKYYGYSLQQYAQLWEINGKLKQQQVSETKLKLKMKKQQNLKYQRQRQKSTQIATQKTGSLASLRTPQVYVSYGSSTSIDNQIQQKQKVKNSPVFQQKNQSSIQYLQTQKTPKNKKESNEHLNFKANKKQNIQQLRSIRQLNMSRVAPYQQLKKKLCWVQKTC